MEKKTLTAKELKKRQMLLILPVLTLPFITILFWIMGGGKDSAQSVSGKVKAGINMFLPNPNLKEDSSLNKLSYYDQAAVDSIKLQELKKKDPNFSIDSLNLKAHDGKPLFNSEPLSHTDKRTGLNTISLQSENETMMYQKLQALQRAISEPPKINDYGQDMREFQYQKPPYGEASEMERLEHLMKSMSAPSEPDPELAQLGGMLENILDIQHPERVQEKLKQDSKLHRGKVFSVSRKVNEENQSSLQNNDSLQQKPTVNSFYSLEAKTISEEVQNAVEACVHETQSIVNGSIVKMRLINDVFINGVFIPKNSFVFGTASLKGERLEVKITTIQHQKSIFPVELSVYDIDGLKGIYIPGTINRDVAKASADRSMQSIGLTGVSDSWGAQAAGMGVEAAKTLLSKKVKLIKVEVKAGYKVLLYDEKEKDEK